MWAAQLGRPVDYLLSAKDFLGLKLALECLSKEKSRFDSGLELKSLRDIFDRIFEEKHIEVIIDELLSRIDKNIFYSDLADIITLAGETMIKPLIEEAMVEDKQLAHLGYFGVYLRRRAIGEILASIAKASGYETICASLKEKLNSNQGATVRNAVDMVMYIQDPSLCDLLLSLIKYPDVDVRKKVALVLSKFPKPGNLHLLVELLKDGDAEVRLNVINLLAKVGDKSSLAMLKNLNDPGHEEAIKAAVAALENRWKGK